MSIYDMMDFNPNQGYSHKLNMLAKEISDEIYKTNGALYKVDDAVFRALKNRMFAIEKSIMVDHVMVEHFSKGRGNWANHELHRVMISIADQLLEKKEMLIGTEHKLEKFEHNFTYELIVLRNL